MPTFRRRVNAVSDDLRDLARAMRSIPAKAEDIFWDQVRAGRLKGHKFKRQVPITPYVVDFLCPAARLVIELDGPHHAEPGQRQHDLRRERWLRAQGFTVLRFPNELILTSAQLALDQILAAIDGRHGPSPCLPPAGCPSPAEGGGTLQGLPP